MPLLTIFSAPKPFSVPHIGLIQRNAIRSWQQFGDDVEVLLVGEEDGMPEVCRELGVKQLAGVARNDQGTPLVSSIFSMARAASDSPVLAYVNADILLLPDFLAAVRQVVQQLHSFLLVGQRWDLDVNAPLEYETGWAERMLVDLHQRGRLHFPAGSDYFAYPRQCFTDIPRFTIGRAGWDNWMIYEAIRQGIPAVDATMSITVIHQSHDYSHLPGGRPHYDLDESDANRGLAGGKKHLYILHDTDRELIDGKVIPARRTLPRLVRRLELSMYSENGELHGLRRFARPILRRVWRRMVAS